MAIVVNNNELIEAQGFRSTGYAGLGYARRKNKTARVWRKCVLFALSRETSSNSGLRRGGRRGIAGKPFTL